MKKVLILLPILVFILTLFLRNDEDDEVFTSYFNKMVSAAESKDLEKFMDFFSVHYKDDRGYNYVIIRSIVKNAFGEFETLRGAFSSLTSSVEKRDKGQSATINMNVQATGTRNGIEVGVLGLSDTPKNITVYLEKSRFEEWKIIKIRE